MPTPGNASPMVSERPARAELGLPAEARYERRAVPWGRAGARGTTKAGKRWTKRSPSPGCSTASRGTAWRRRPRLKTAINGSLRTVTNREKGEIK